MGDNQASVGFYCSAPLIRWRICDASPILALMGVSTAALIIASHGTESSLIFRRWTGRRPFRFIRQKNLNQAAQWSRYIAECEFACWNLISPNERHNYSETTIANSRKTILILWGALCLTVHPLHMVWFIDKMTAKMAVHSVDSVQREL